MELKIEEKHILKLNEAVNEAHQKIADLVDEILSEYFERGMLSDANYPIMLSERVVNNFVLNLLQRIYKRNNDYAYETILRNEIKKKVDKERERMPDENTKVVAG